MLLHKDVRVTVGLPCRFTCSSRSAISPFADPVGPRNPRWGPGSLHKWLGGILHTDKHIATVRCKQPQHIAATHDGDRCKQPQHIAAQEELQDFVSRWATRRGRPDTDRRTEAQNWCEVCAAFAADARSTISATFGEARFASDAPTKTTQSSFEVVSSFRSSSHPSAHGERENVRF